MFDKRDIQRSFSRHAGTYEQHASLQKHVLKQACTYLMPHIGAGDTVLDVGCGTGQLYDFLPDNSNLVGCDLSFSMCQQAQTRLNKVVCADADTLPFADECTHAVMCSLMLQWANQYTEILREMYRVLRPGGVAMITSFGPDTLQELRMAFAHADDAPHVSDFPAIDVVAENIANAGFPILDSKLERIVLPYGCVRDLMQSMRVIGAANHLAGRRKTFTGKGRMRDMEDYYLKHFPTKNGVRATWDVHYCMVHKPKDNT